MTTKDELCEGDRLRLVSNRDTRAQGYPCYGGAPGDHVIAAGEIGTVARRPYTSNKPMAHWCLEFSRGRCVSLSTPADTPSAEATHAHFLLDSQAQDWRRA